MLSRDELIRTLRQRLEQATARSQSERVSSGSAGLDRLLPARGFRRGTLVEWQGEPGGGATTMALVAARAACGTGGALVVVDRSPTPATGLRFHPPAAAALGIDLEKLILVRPTNLRDERWAMTQALSSPAVAAVLCWPEKLDSHVCRRWQLAAEQGGALGLLVRSAFSQRAEKGARLAFSWQAEKEARPAFSWQAEKATGTTWSEVRLRVEGVESASPRRLRIELLRSRASGELRTHEGQSIELEIGEEGQIHETSPLHLVPRVAAAKIQRRSAGA